MAHDDHERSDGLVGTAGANGKRPPRPKVTVEITFDPETSGTEIRFDPPAVIRNRVLMYGLLETVRDIVYRQQLPGELAILADAQQRGPQIVVPDGPLPPFRKL